MLGLVSLAWAGGFGRWVWGVGVDGVDAMAVTVSATAIFSATVELAAGAALDGGGDVTMLGGVLDAVVDATGLFGETSPIGLGAAATTTAGGGQRWP